MSGSIYRALSRNRVGREAKADLRKVFEGSGYRGVRRRALEVRIERTQKNCTDRQWDAVVDLAYLGEGDRMFECLQQWVRLPGNSMLLRDRWVSKYRSDPRFTAILKEMGLEEYWQEEAKQVRFSPSSSHSSTASARPG